MCMWMELHLPTVMSTAKTKVVRHELNVELWLELMLLPEMLMKGQQS